MTQPNLGDRCTLAANPKAPPLTVALVYLQGDPEAAWVGCRWHKTAQLVHFPVADLVTEGGA